MHTKYSCRWGVCWKCCPGMPWSVYRRCFILICPETEGWQAISSAAKDPIHTAHFPCYENILNWITAFTHCFHCWNSWPCAYMLLKHLRLALSHLSVASNSYCSFTAPLAGMCWFQVGPSWQSFDFQNRLWHVLNLCMKHAFVKNDGVNRWKFYLPLANQWLTQYALFCALLDCWHSLDLLILLAAVNSRQAMVSDNCHVLDCIILLWEYELHTPSPTWWAP